MGQIYIYEPDLYIALIYICVPYKSRAAQTYHMDSSSARVRIGGSSNVSVIMASSGHDHTDESIW